MKVFEYIQKGVFLTDLMYPEKLGDESDTVTDPDKVSKKLIENIHQLIRVPVAAGIGGALSVVYLAMFISIYRNKDKPHI